VYLYFYVIQKLSFKKKLPLLFMRNTIRRLTDKIEES